MIKIETDRSKAARIRARFGSSDDRNQMIPIHQLPMARWRKTMREECNQCATEGSECGYCEADRRNADRRTTNWQNWQAAEAIRHKRQRWIYGFITATVLALIGFLVMGGCR